MFAFCPPSKMTLLDSFHLGFPEQIEACLEDGYVNICQFNHCGNLLAAGCQDGRVLVWDFDTRGLARKLCGHVARITSISWPRHPAYLLSSSHDWNCILWNIVNSERVYTFNFHSAVMCALAHPTKNHMIAVFPYMDSPQLIHLKKKKKFVDNRINVDENNQDCIKIKLPALMENVAIQAEQSNDPQLQQNSPAVPRDKHYGIIAAFSHNGAYLLAGNHKGNINFIDMSTHQMVYSMQVTNNVPIRSISFNKKGTDFLVNAADRTLRSYTFRQDKSNPVLNLNTHNSAERRDVSSEMSNTNTFQPPKFMHKFQDLVNRFQWAQGCCFSADDEYVVAGAETIHSIYIWDKTNGNLVKILEGPKEATKDLSWHPSRSVIASVSSWGNIFIWTSKVQENWSAFAPDFQELEENVEYEEKEDEFDIVEPDAKQLEEENEQKKLRDEHENEIVDVTTINRPYSYLDSDSDFESSDESDKEMELCDSSSNSRPNKKEKEKIEDIGSLKLKRKRRKYEDMLGPEGVLIIPVKPEDSNKRPLDELNNRKRVDTSMTVTERISNTVSPSPQPIENLDTGIQPNGILEKTENDP